MKFMPSLLIIATCAGVLTGCGASADSPQAAVPQTYKGIITTEQGDYEFAAQSCYVHYEEGIPDIELSGAGTSPDGEVIFVEYSSTGNALSIAFGVDQAMVSAERTYVAGQIVSAPLELDISDNFLKLGNIVFRTEQGEILPGIGQMSVDCR